MSDKPFAKPYSPPPVSPETRLGDYLPNGGRRRESEDSAMTPRAVAQAVGSALDRLEEVIDQETAGLASRQRMDFRDINRRKSQALLELTRLARSLAPGDGSALSARLRGLRNKLLDNRHLLEMHVNAVRDIAELMVNVIGESESDGTYGMVRPRTGAR